MRPTLIELVELLKEMETVHIVYHRTDIDGRCSAAVVLYWLQLLDLNADISFYGVNYGEPAPEIMVWGSRTAIFLVDFSFPVDVMRKWEGGAGLFVWIDHHASSIERAEQESFYSPYFFLEEGRGACALAWDFLVKASVELSDKPPQRYLPDFPLKTGVLPEAVRLASLYDVWATDGPFWSDDDPAYLLNLALKEETNTGPLDLNCEGTVLNPFWRKLFFYSAITEQHFLNKGRMLQAEQKRKWESLMRQSFVMTWEGLRWLCVNASGLSSQAFADKFNPELHDAMLFFSFGTGGEEKGTWLVRLRSYDVEKNPVRPIAEANGGGGHPGAADFHCQYLPFSLPAREV